MATGQFDSGWLAAFRLSFERDLDRISGARPDSARGQKILEAATRRVEELLSLIFHQVDNQESVLQRELAASGIEIDFLRDQLCAFSEQVREANKSKNPGLIRSAVVGLAAPFGAVAGGAAEGIASHVAEAITSDTAAGSSGPNSREISEACASFTDALEIVIDESMGTRASSERDSGQTTDEILARIDDLLEADAEEFVKSYIQTGPQ